MEQLPPIHIGCCGFPRGMTTYFGTFRVVEVQQTFYKPPQVKTALRWRAKAPPDFVFSLKAWQLITHSPTSPTYRRSGLRLGKEDRSRYGFFRPTAEVWAAWETTKEIARALQARLIVFQCPASFKPTEENVENLRGFFQTAAQEGMLFVWEPRGQWPAELVDALCAELDLIHGLDPLDARQRVEGIGRGEKGGVPTSSLPAISCTLHPLPSHPNYFRLHGGPGYRHQYSYDELVLLREMCRDRESYVMFNNIWMYEDALRFRDLVAQA